MQRACSCGQASPNLFAVLRHACMRMQQSGSSLHDAAACSSPPAVAWSLIQQPPPLPRARPTEHRLVSAAGDHPGSGYPLFSCSIQRTWPPATRASGCGEGPALDWFVWFDWLVGWLVEHSLPGDKSLSDCDCISPLVLPCPCAAHPPDWRGDGQPECCCCCGACQ